MPRREFLGYSQGNATDGVNFGGGACGFMVEDVSFLIEAVGDLNFTGYQTRGEPAVGVWLRECESRRGAN